MEAPPPPPPPYTTCLPPDTYCNLCWKQLINTDPGSAYHTQFSFLKKNISDISICVINLILIRFGTKRKNFTSPKHAIKVNFAEFYLIFQFMKFNVHDMSHPKEDKYQTITIVELINKEMVNVKSLNSQGPIFVDCRFITYFIGMLFRACLGFQFQ